MDFVGEERVALSTAPVLVGSSTQPRHIVMRAHLVATVDVTPSNAGPKSVGSPEAPPADRPSWRWS
jgi:uncharacterized circularly permuted ATP-grasp superfamily protein